MPPIVLHPGRFKKVLTSRWSIASMVVLLLIGGYWYFFGKAKDTYQFITVTQGSITETVSVTGNTTPTKSVSLGFQNTGTIARVSYNLGDRGSAGTGGAELNIGKL